MTRCWTFSTPTKLNVKVLDVFQINRIECHWTFSKSTELNVKVLDVFHPYKIDWGGELTGEFEPQGVLKVIRYFTSPNYVTSDQSRLSPLAETLLTRARLSLFTPARVLTIKFWFREFCLLLMTSVSRREVINSSTRLGLQQCRNG
ncbi:hypothetical protein ElyMa_005198900 [Elysia marginata]|uniref:CUB domain-containing protein n=1 Tax=Elysia marginata TaxID=1093978 RepID=A0AAV4JT76_9GAST|nr:hypothetical protein ElyMa_005198900 [Elysia marginata]